jgi:hypothetical protein
MENEKKLQYVNEIDHFPSHSTWYPVWIE